MKPDVVIIGSGMAALGAANLLRNEGVDSVLFDRSAYPGGHTASFHYPSGFIFDDGPHISFTQDARIQSLLADSLEQSFETLQCRVNNYWRGHWIKHPAQVNLFGLPPELIDRIIGEFRALPETPAGAIENYMDWLRASFGNTFSEKFPALYGRKYHTCAAEMMTTDWLGPRIYRPKIEEVIYGAAHESTPDVHYVTHFRYPKSGGFYAYLEPWIRQANLHLEHEVTSIDPAGRFISFAGGNQISYDRLLSTMPLPELIKRIPIAPAEVKEAAAKLACTTCVNVNIGVDRDDVSDHHWTYFYDEDISFTRLSFPHLFSASTAPAGASSIQAECYYSDKYRPLTSSLQKCADAVIRDLIRVGLLREDDRLLMVDTKVVQYANVIFDLDRPAALATVHGYLEDIGIGYAGRYGEWGYHWTDDAYKSGEAAAQRLLR